jgi:hypothetical protein
MFVAGSKEQENYIEISHLLVTVKPKIGFSGLKTGSTDLK